MNDSLNMPLPGEMPSTTYAPSYLQNRCFQVNVVFVRPASMGVRRPAWSLEVPMDLTPANPPRRMEFHDESSNVFSLGRSATADIAWKPDLPL